MYYINYQYTCKKNRHIASRLKVTHISISRLYSAKFVTFRNYKIFTFHVYRCNITTIAKTERVEIFITFITLVHQHVTESDKICRIFTTAHPKVPINIKAGDSFFYKTYNRSLVNHFLVYIRQSSSLSVTTYIIYKIFSFNVQK
jgi:hypothetical protein